MQSLDGGRSMTRPRVTVPQLIGHRGARGVVAENTLESFACAYASGVDAVELDVGMTADGIAVVTHDRRLNPALTRDADGSWLAPPGPLLHAMTLAELQRYDVGRMDPASEYAGELTAQRSVDGARVPTLEQVLDMTQAVAGTDIELIIEVKTSPEAPQETAAPEVIAQVVVELVQAKAMTASVIIESLDWRVMQYVQRVAADIRTAYLTVQRSWLDNLQRAHDGACHWTAGWDLGEHDDSVPDLVGAAGGSTWAPFFKDASTADIARAHALGMQVIVWTVNTATDMRAMIDCGVDGIITDYPERLRAVMGERGMQLPPPRPSAHR